MMPSDPKPTPLTMSAEREENIRDCVDVQYDDDLVDLLRELDAERAANAEMREQLNDSESLRAVCHSRHLFEEKALVVAREERDALEKQLAETREQLAQAQWQPIETAPRDKWYLALVPNEDGEPFYLLRSDGMGDDGYSPTYWMPLPQPPNAARGALRAKQEVAPECRAHTAVFGKCRLPQGHAEQHRNALGNTWRGGAMARSQGMTESEPGDHTNYVTQILMKMNAALAESDESFLEFARLQAEWSQATFGTDAERGPIGPLKHLAKEVQEALANTEDPMEYVDCFFLVLDASRRAKIPAPRLLELAFEKLEINKARKWNKPTSDDPVEHDRSGEVVIPQGDEGKK